MNLAGSAIDFPFRVDQTGDIVTTSDRTRLIEQEIVAVIETQRGEHVMMPDYGIPDFVFGTVNSAFIPRLAHWLETQIVAYVPLVAKAKVTGGTDDEGRVVANVEYWEVGTVDAPRNLVYPIWRLVSQ